MSPYIAIRRMATISETYGVERARRDGDLRRTEQLGDRDVSASAVKIEGRRMVDRNRDSDSTPDTKLRG